MADKHCNCPEYKDKYKEMGVSPEELYLRQEGLCYLTLVTDYIDGTEVPGDLYCTDGKDFALTKSMLNPTTECMNCIATHFLNREIEHMTVFKDLNKSIVTLLRIISTEDTIDINRVTLDKLEDSLLKLSLASKESNPLRVCADGELYLFGKKVYINEDIEDDHILIKPTNSKVKLSI